MQTGFVTRLLFYYKSAQALDGEGGREYDKAKGEGCSALLTVVRQLRGRHQKP